MIAIEITTDLVRRLISEQFPEWKHLEIRPVNNSGHDNRTYHLGTEMTVRLPSHERYASAVEKELTWLPQFKSRLSLPIPSPLAKGEPTDEYPLPWSVNQWIAGETVTDTNIRDRTKFAQDLADFLKELEAIDATGGVPAGVQNFHRGGDLAVYDSDTRSVIEQVSGSGSGVYSASLLTEIWELALATKYHSAPLWIHGDIAVGNLLVSDGRLSGVIDFGTMGVGDPASDLVMAWNYFDAASRSLFLGSMNLGDDTVDRARGWALWKALITYHWNDKQSIAAHWGRRAIDRIIEEYTAH
ncbi:aminoglycoside phosphotransferase family protein [Paenibacillus sp. OV219]|uniref:aminoglycoside phosphotransferase family protein n=1 Tax=Paenibacillus sp. OV219 TaxID=1884377 RepID=UPI0008D2F887|nr:aminoglycoside phosphotransferase family protein [Paenibacillus sp. OV219]SEN50509.1 Predicted kinase, aminoglycoside phosphotransferase (APT) family [Paenibacillus sp. OV219]